MVVRRMGFTVKAKRFKVQLLCTSHLSLPSPDFLISEMGVIVALPLMVVEGHMRQNVKHSASAGCFHCPRSDLKTWGGARRWL